MRHFLVHLGEVLLADRVGDGELARIVGDEVVDKDQLALLRKVEKRVKDRLRPALGGGDGLDPFRRSRRL